jgi:hypothetical protein
MASWPPARQKGGKEHGFVGLVFLDFDQLIDIGVPSRTVELPSRRLAGVADGSTFRKTSRSRGSFDAFDMAQIPGLFTLYYSRLWFSGETPTLNTVFDLINEHDIRLSMLQLIGQRQPSQMDDYQCGTPSIFPWPRQSRHSALALPKY